MLVYCVLIDVTFECIYQITGYWLKCNFCAVGVPITYPYMLPCSWKDAGLCVSDSYNSYHHTGHGCHYKDQIVLAGYIQTTFCFCVFLFACMFTCV